MGKAGMAFRAYRYAADYPGLKGKTLKPYCKANEHDKCFGKGMKCRENYHTTRADVPWPMAETQEVREVEIADEDVTSPPPYSSYFPYHGEKLPSEFEDGGRVEAFAEEIAYFADAYPDPSVTKTSNTTYDPYKHPVNSSL